MLELKRCWINPIGKEEAWCVGIKIRQSKQIL